MSLNESERQRLLIELRRFCDGLMRYKELVLAGRNGKLVDEHEREFQVLSLDLQRNYGSLKEVIEKYGGPAVLLLQGGNYKCEAFLEMFSPTKFHPSAFVLVMDKAIATVNMAVGRLESPDLCEGFVCRTTWSPPKAFIAHGGESKALARLEEFLDALGLESLIVEKKPSEGRSINQNVERYLEQADCAIVLATMGDIDGQTGELLPRGNILVEIGRCQEGFPEKMIYLLEEGTKFPSNISEKVWEHFTQDNMERAFIKVAKELRAFGIIKAEHPDN